MRDRANESGPDQVAKLLLDGALRTHRSATSRAALRCGLGDAASLCDSIAAEVGAGRRSKQRQELAAVAKRCGDAIWAMRSKVEVPR